MLRSHDHFQRKAPAICAGRVRRVLQYQPHAHVAEQRLASQAPCSKQGTNRKNTRHRRLASHLSSGCLKSVILLGFTVTVCANGKETPDFSFRACEIRPKSVNLNFGKSIFKLRDIANQSIWLSDVFLHRTACVGCIIPNG